ncbi:MAG: SEC-C metal-binding domain-containing protein, partial [bacterium]|nr:SEC-C metal-binding domain-containing protein [bacterium]
KGQPVLVGTVSIQKNEILSALLKKEGVAHELLNAKNHEREAQIVANAGRKGAVTVATNMAGRGVDIILGGRPAEGQDKNDWQAAHDTVIAAGGLHIIGTERHEARRIDDQLRGRAGRQGDPGSSRFFVSLEDDLMRIFAPDRVKSMMEFLKVPEDQAIENKMVSRAIEGAQAKIEGYNFDIRKHVLEYDDVMNKQRETIYRRRREVFEKASIKDEVQEIIASEIAKIVKFHAPGEWPEDWNLEEIREVLKTIFPLPVEAQQNMTDAKNRDDLVDYLIGLAKTAYEAKEKQLGDERMREIEKMFYLRTTDMFWMEHLDEMGYLRDSVRLRAYGQRDPLVEYKNEGIKLFQRLLVTIQTSFVGSIYKVEMMSEQAAERKEVRNILAGQVVSESKKNEVGRNNPCPCGSGKKYKKCHGI